MAEDGNAALVAADCEKQDHRNGGCPQHDCWLDNFIPEIGTVLGDTYTTKILVPGLLNQCHCRYRNGIVADCRELLLAWRFGPGWGNHYHNANSAFPRNRSLLRSVSVQHTQLGERNVDCGCASAAIA